MIIGIINNIIKDIEKTVAENEGVIRSVGLSNGLSGISIYYYYLSLYYKDEKYLSKSAVVLQTAIGFINDGQAENFKKSDIVDLGRTIHFFYEHGVIEESDVINFIENSSSLIEEYLQNLIQNNPKANYFEIIGIAHYYLDIFSFQKSNKLLYKIIEFLQVQAEIHNENELYWLSCFRNVDKLVVETGFYHGISGILRVLSRCIENDYKKDTCKILINKSCNYLVNHIKKNQVNWIPTTIRPSESLNYHNLAYGDIGIGFSLFKLQKTEFLNFHNYGAQILENVAKFKDFENSIVRDAELMYGSAGIFSVFESIKNNSPIFKQISYYWLKKTLKYYNPKDSWSGYNTYRNGDDITIKLSFFHGIAGIGTSLVCYQMDINHDYLKLLNYG